MNIQSISFENKPTTKEADAAGMYSHSESEVSTQNEGKNREKVYVPVNAIPDEVYALISAWEASSLKSPDCMDIDEASNPLSVSMLGPAQSLNTFAPPKRYGRTFWRSASRRILEMSRAQSLVDALADDLQARS